MITEQTLQAGEVGIEGMSDQVVVDLPEGFMGKHNLTHFALVPSAISPSPFYVLLSLDEAGVAFGLADPSQLFANYEVDLAVEREVLDIQADEEAKLYVVLTMGDNPLRTTANLLAPLLLNARAKLGRQLVLSDSRYSTKHPIIASRQQ